MANRDLSAADPEDIKVPRSEKKARKMFGALNLKSVPGVSRVCFRKSKSILFIIDKPDVFQAGLDSYIVFGEARIEDLSQYGQRIAADRVKPDVMSCAPTAKPSEEEKLAQLEEEVIYFDENGVDPKDIELVMSQANVSRTKAVKALKENDNDIVNAIMDLTS
uniref:NAC-A/B domain-containing protein n=1 Tax=Steinernema glaseri TaxID=37863 RepID=A0A1I7YJX4_9BILA